MITKIETYGLNGRKLDLELSYRTLIVGPNGSGKTTALNAAKLALWGYIDGMEKTAAAIYGESTGPLCCGTVVDGKKIERTWQRTAKGTISETASISGVEVKGAAADGMIRLALGYDPLFDSAAFFELSDRLQRAKLLSLVGKDSEAMLKAADEARDGLKAVRAKLQQARKTAERLTAEVAKLEAPAGDPLRIKSEIEKAEAAGKEQCDMIRAADANRAQREQLQRRSGLRPEVEAEIAKLAEAETLAGQEAHKIELQHGDIIGKVKALQEKAVAIPEAVLSELTGIRDELVTHDLRGMVSRLTAIIDAANPDGPVHQELAKLDTALKTNRRAADTAASKLSGIKVELATERQRLRDVVGAESSLKALPPQPESGDRALAEKLGARVKELRAQLEAMTRRDAIQSQQEAAKLDADRLEADEAKQKEKVAETENAIKVAFLVAVGSVEQKVGGALPFGRMAIMDSEETGLFIGIMRGATPIRRANLSGAERVLFDGVFSRAITDPRTTVLIDAGEVSDVTLNATLSRLPGGTDSQYIAARWTNGPDGESTSLRAPDGWSIVAL